MKGILLGCLMLSLGAKALIDTPIFPDQGQLATVMFIFGLGSIYLGINEYYELNSPAILQFLKTGLILLVIGFALYGLIVNNMSIATRGGIFRIHGLALWMMCGAIISAFLPTLSKILAYDALKKISKYSGEAFLVFLILSLYSGIYMAVKSI